eukprot:8209906-Lingulodinium_polyedra.AAC.1
MPEVPEVPDVPTPDVNCPKRHRFTVYPGPSRQDLLLTSEMVPKRVKYLWDAKVPRHLNATIQDE